MSISSSSLDSRLIQYPAEICLSTDRQQDKPAEFFLKIPHHKSLSAGFQCIYVRHKKADNEKRIGDDLFNPERTQSLQVVSAGRIRYLHCEILFEYRFNLLVRGNTGAPGPSNLARRPPEGNEDEAANSYMQPRLQL